MGQDQLKTRSLKFHQDNRGRVQSKEVQQKTFVTPVAEAAEQLVSEGEAVEAAAIKTQRQSTVRAKFEFWSNFRKKWVQ